MRTEQLESNWTEVKGQVKERWSKLTNEDITAIHGKKDKLLSTLRERYGYNADQAEKEYGVFLKECNCNGTAAVKGSQNQSSDSQNRNRPSL